jgi:hypothetical protein
MPSSQHAAPATISGSESRSMPTMARPSPVVTMRKWAMRNRGMVIPKA